MIAADEFHCAVGDVFVRVFRADFVIIVDFQAMFCPGARFMHDVQEGEVAIRAVGKVYFVHDASLLFFRPYFLPSPASTSAIAQSTQ
jgi:hypothetical protein